MHHLLHFPSPHSCHTMHNLLQRSSSNTYYITHPLSLKIWFISSKPHHVCIETSIYSIVKFSLSYDSPHNTPPATFPIVKHLLHCPSSPKWFTKSNLVFFLWLEESTIGPVLYLHDTRSILTTTTITPRCPHMPFLHTHVSQGYFNLKYILYITLHLHNTC